MKKLLFAVLVIVLKILFFTNQTFTQDATPRSITEFYAQTSVDFFANYLVGNETLGGSGADSKDIKVHLKWAVRQTPKKLEDELILKMNTMANVLSGRSDKSYISNWYAAICTKWSNYNVDFGSGAANSRDYNVHFHWATSQSKDGIIKQIENRIQKIFEAFGKKQHTAGENPLLVPGLVIGLRMSIQKNDPFEVPSNIVVEHWPRSLSYIMSGASKYATFGFYIIPCKTGEDPYKWILPAGIVVGLMYGEDGVTTREDYKVFDQWATSGPIYLGNDYFKREHGGDIGAPSGQGWYWYESTGNGFKGDVMNIINQLPRGTVVGLKHSLNQPNKYFIWNGKKYDPRDPNIAPPQGFVRKHGGDFGAPAGEGYYWYEKVTEPISYEMIEIK